MVEERNVNSINSEKKPIVYKKKFNYPKLAAQIYIWLMLFIMYAPILLLMVFSFTKSAQIGKWTGFSLEPYRMLFSSGNVKSQKIWQAVRNTAIVAIVSSVLSTLLGSIGAIGMFYSKKKIRKILDFVTQIPVVNAEIVMALSLTILFVFVKVERSLVTLIIGHMVLSIPFVVLSVQPKLEQMDPNLYEAAMDLGSNPTQALLKVVLPEILPGVLSGFMLAITLSLDDYIITFFTMPKKGEFSETLSTYVEAATKKAGLPIQLRAFTTILFIIILLVMIIYNIKVKKNSRKESK